jgi:hypothetical protein
MHVEHSLQEHRRASGYISRQDFLSLLQTNHPKDTSTDHTALLREKQGEFYEKMGEINNPNHPKEVTICPIHNNTHYCDYKIQGGKCECICTCNHPKE